MVEHGDQCFNIMSTKIKYVERHIEDRKNA